MLTFLRRLVFIDQVFVLKKKRSDKKAIMKNKIEFDDELLEILYENGVGKPGIVNFLIINVFIIFFLAFQGQIDYYRNDGKIRNFYESFILVISRYCFFIAISFGSAFPRLYI